MIIDRSNATYDRAVHFFMSRGFSKTDNTLNFYRDSQNLIRHYRTQVFSSSLLEKKDGKYQKSTVLLLMTPTAFFNVAFFVQIFTIAFGTQTVKI